MLRICTVNSPSSCTAELFQIQATVVMLLIAWNEKLVLIKKVRAFVFAPLQIESPEPANRQNAKWKVSAHWISGRPLICIAMSSTRSSLLASWCCYGYHLCSVWGCHVR